MTKDKLLDLFCQNENTRLSGGQLADKLGVSRNAVWKAVAALKEEGFLIESVPNKGYVYTGHDDRVLSPLALSYYRRDNHTLLLFSSLISTNEYMQSHLNDLKNDTVVIANEQTSGRSKKNGFFASPSGTGIYMSVYMTPPIFMKHLPLVTWSVLDMVRECLAKNFPAPISIRWPNRLYIGDKCVCGVLTNCSVEAESGLLQSAIIGIGIHVNDDETEEFTSLKCATGQKVNRHKLIAEILAMLEENRSHFSHHHLDEKTLCHVNRYLYQKDRRVQVTTIDGEELCGNLESVNDQGAICLALKDGKTVTFQSGELL